MRTAFYLTAVLLTAAPCLATLIPLSGGASVGASGSITINALHGGGGDSFNHTESSAIPFGAFHGAVGDSIQRTVEPLPGWFYFLPLDYKASSNARQDALVRADGISIDGSLRAASWPHAQAGWVGAHARSVFDVTFRIDELMSYDLELRAIMPQRNFFQVIPPVFSLQSLDGTFALDMTDVRRMGLFEWGLDGTGLLAPGDYRLVYNLDAGAYSDPTGDFGYATFGLQLNVSRVPEIAESAVLLSLGVAALAVVRRRRGLLAQSAG